jgi:hypothetical protein
MFALHHGLQNLFTGKGLHCLENDGGYALNLFPFWLGNLWGLADGGAAAGPRIAGIAEKARRCATRSWRQSWTSLSGSFSATPHLYRRDAPGTTHEPGNRLSGFSA